MDSKKYIQTDKLKTLKFTEVSFNVLMKKRIRKVLIICSKYDFFMLEEDGRIDEQIFNEYVSLNLRYPPQFIHVDTADKAFKVLANKKIDLIIEMLSVGGSKPFALAKRLKEEYKKIPIVVLTNFSREVNQILLKEDVSAIDYVFSWLGNADLLLAIIKLVEDKMNVAADVKSVGVQSILLVEDSIRFYSSYLPTIYKMVLKQSLKFMEEGLNEHQKMLKLRGRPKILLARNYEEAMKYLKKYPDHLLGVISDVRYPRKRSMNACSGIKLAKKIKYYDKYLPILLQSSEKKNESVAKKLHVGFINKNSSTLTNQLQKFINEYFAFGDFIVRDPKTGYEIMRLADLGELQNRLFEMPDNAFEYHMSRDHFSKWLKARALFSIADIFRSVSVDDFTDLNQARNFIFNIIESFRRDKGKGIIAKFYRDKYNEYLGFTRLGEGSIGGKARGLAFMDTLIKSNPELDNFENVNISIPRTVVLSTDVFDEFMEMNSLYDIAYSDQEDEVILDAFSKALIPDRIRRDLYTIASVSTRPMAIRSSSLLEDSHYQPFAGVYSTYMIPYTEDSYLMTEMILKAIKEVYASVYYKSSKAYLTATRHVIDEEKMSIILQEVCGKQHGNYFYPTISGVVRSINFYPIEPEKSEDAVAQICYGLGKQIVEGGRSLRFSPKYPKKILQLSDTSIALRDTQKKFYALDLDPEKFVVSTNDAINLANLNISSVNNDGAFKHVCSTYDYNDRILRDGNHKGLKIMSFANILKYDAFPLSKILETVCKIAENGLNLPVEIEFAMTIPDTLSETANFNLLQVRPIVESDEILNEDISKIPVNDTLIHSPKALGNGEITGVRDLIYVKTEAFNPADNPKIVSYIDELNSKFLDEEKNYVLVGPGRWGSSDHWLGIPVKWANISAAKVIVEAGLPNYRIEPSQGTHFFQNLTSFRVAYMTVNVHANEGHYDTDFLNQKVAVMENKYLRHVHFENDLVIKVDAKKNIGLIMCGEEEN